MLLCCWIGHCLGITKMSAIALQTLYFTIGWGGEFRILNCQIGFGKYHGCCAAVYICDAKGGRKRDDRLGSGGLRLGGGERRLRIANCGLRIR